MHTNTYSVWLWNAWKSCECDAFSLLAAACLDVLSWKHLGNPSRQLPDRPRAIIVYDHTYKHHPLSFVLFHWPELKRLLRRSMNYAVSQQLSAEGQSILGLQYSRGEWMKVSAAMRLTANCVKELWRSHGEVRGSSSILHDHPEIVNALLPNLSWATAPPIIRPIMWNWIISGGTPGDL